MKSVLILIVIAILGFQISALAQDPPLGTNRLEGLKLKAKLDYEKKALGQRVQNQPAQKHPVQQAAPQPRQQMDGRKADSRKSVTCKSGMEVRDLDLLYKGHGCELFYVKAGENKSQARQNNGTTICDSVFEKMRTTLEKTGFVCESKKD